MNERDLSVKEYYTHIRITMGEYDGLNRDLRLGRQRIAELERERDGWRADAEREGKNVIFHRENHDESKRRLEEAVEMLVQLRDRLSEVACDADRLLAGVDAARAAAKGGEGE